MTRTDVPTAFRQHSLGYRVNHLARLLEQALRDAIAEYGVVPGQFAQLLALYEAEPLTQGELCRRVRIDQSTMAKTLLRMERDGLIERTADPSDARRALIRLTPHARSLRRQLVGAAAAVNARASAGMDSESVDAVLTATGRMIANLETDTEDVA